MAKWILKNSKVDIGLMATTLNISKTTAAVLANRGIRTQADAIKYLNPELKLQYDPFCMLGMREAVELTYAAIENQQKIAVYGDYDVDGVTSTVILYKLLEYHGSDVIYYIPHREKEGYGLNKFSCKELRDRGVDLLITCDNGIAAKEEIAYAKQLGMKTIIIDHHEPPETDFPIEAEVIIDPKQRECTYPYKMLCAGGLAYKFALAFHQHTKKTFALHDEFLIFACMATFCDVVDLLDENRIIAKKGLELLNTDANTNIGLRALIREKNIDDKILTSYDIGFILGPCINASGRLEIASMAVDLFITSDTQEAAILAKQLSDLNEERKKMTVDAVNRALQGLEKYESSSVLVIYDETIHESIAGIVAGKIKDTVYKPTIVLTKGEEFIKGSARSIESYNIFEEMSACKYLFERFGGHAMAAGLSIKSENISLLDTFLNENCKLTTEDFVEVIRIDKELPLDEITYNLACELDYLRPFGKANKEPLLGLKGAKVTRIDLLGANKQTVRFTFSIDGTNRTIKGVCFNKFEKLKVLLETKYSMELTHGMLSTDKYITLDIIYSIEINEYNGNTFVQIIVKDFR